MSQKYTYKCRECGAEFNASHDTYSHRNCHDCNGKRTAVLKGPAMSREDRQEEQIVELIAENSTLLDRIRELEAQAVTAEQNRRNAIRLLNGNEPRDYSVS